jgi:hypothetical protein
MSEWINLNIDTESLKVEKEFEDGVKVIISPSPYDVPGAMKVEYDRTKSELRINFRYIGTEPLKYRSAQAGCSFAVGKNSGRLYEIGVRLEGEDVTEQDIPELVARIASEIDRLPHNEEREENYRLAKRALQLGQVPIYVALNPVMIKETAV